MSNNEEKEAGKLSADSVRIAERLIETQNKELEVRQQEVQVKSRDVDNQKELALSAIQAKKYDRQESRKTYERESTKTKVFVLAVIIVLAVFSLVLVWLEYVSLAEEIIKYALTATLGAFGGYGYARTKTRNQS